MSATLRFLLVIGLAGVLLGAPGCSKQKDAEGSRAAMSERERDSTIAKSRLPGAGAVGSALAESDSARARAARLDSLAR